jgi:hypothetical protein
MPATVNRPFTSLEGGLDSDNNNDGSSGAVPSSPAVVKFAADLIAFVLHVAQPCGSVCSSKQECERATEGFHTLSRAVKFMAYQRVRGREDTQTNRYVCWVVFTYMQCEICRSTPVLTYLQHVR